MRVWYWNMWRGWFDCFVISLQLQDYGYAQYTVNVGRCRRCFFCDAVDRFRDGLDALRGSWCGELCCRLVEKFCGCCLST